MLLVIKDREECFGFRLAALRNTPMLGLAQNWVQFCSATRVPPRSFRCDSQADSSVAGCRPAELRMGISEPSRTTKLRSTSKAIQWTKQRRKVATWSENLVKYSVCLSALTNLRPH